MEEVWVREILDAYQRTGIAFFFKQWGGTNKKQAGRLLDGRTWEQDKTLSVRSRLSRN